MTWPGRPLHGRLPPCTFSRPFPAALFAALLLLLFVPPAARGGELLTRVVSVHDGDTLTVVLESRKIRVRLRDIDAPELSQPHGHSARRSLADVCLGKLATLEAGGRDRYRRTIARVACAGTDAGLEQVRRGYAWTYARYAPRQSPLFAVEREAREARRGLWSTPDPHAPWEWRRNGHRAAQARAVQPEP